MPEITATSSLYEAWADRHDIALRGLQQALHAPALVTPERVEELREDASTAEAQYRYWLREDTGR